MNWPRTKAIFKRLPLLWSLLLIGCGVKGDPLPPERPVELGRGRPTYRRATEGIQIQQHRSIHDEEEVNETEPEEDER